MNNQYLKIPPGLLLQCSICNRKFKKEEIDDFLEKHSHKVTHIKQKLLQIQNTLETSQSLADFNISIGFPCCQCFHVITPLSTKKDRLIGAFIFILANSLLLLFFLYLLLFCPNLCHFLPSSPVFPK